MRPYAIHTSHDGRDIHIQSAHFYDIYADKKTKRGAVQPFKCKETLRTLPLFFRNQCTPVTWWCQGSRRESHMWSMSTSIMQMTYNFPWLGRLERPFLTASLKNWNNMYIIFQIHAPAQGVSTIAFTIIFAYAFENIYGFSFYLPLLARLDI